MTTHVIVRNAPTETTVIVPGPSTAPGVYAIPPRGPEGDSAYQVAVANGFVGTEAEWLETLVGPSGVPGGIADVPGLQAALDAEASARSSADTALDGRLDVVEDPTYRDARYYTKPQTDDLFATKADVTALEAYTSLTALADEASTRAAADTAEASARAAADAAHAADTTDVHGIADTSTLVVTTDPRLSDARTPTAHTHTSASITDFVEAAQDAVAALLSGASGVSLSYDDAANTLTITGGGSGGLDAEAVRDAIGVALIGTGLISVVVNDAADTITISTTATANSTDAALRDRSTHTGTQAIATVLGLQAALDSEASTRASADTSLQGQIDTLGTSKAPVIHLHGSSDITDFNEGVDDRVAALLTQGAAITLTYNDAAGTLTIAANVGTGAGTVAAGNDSRITGAVQSSALTELVQDIVGAMVTDSATVTKTYDDTAGTLTLSAAAGYTDEQVRDVMGAALVAGSNVTITPNDAGDTITISATPSAAFDVTVWDSVTAYASGAVVSSDNALWIANAPSTNSQPSTTRVLTAAGADGTAAGFGAYAGDEYIHPFELTADTLVAGFSLGSLNGHYPTALEIGITQAVPRPTGSTAPTLIAPATLASPVSAGGSGTFIDRFLLNDPIQLQANVTYHLWVRDPTGNKFVQAGGAQISFSAGVSFSGIMKQPDDYGTAGIYDFYRVTSGAWTQTDANRALIVGVLSTTELTWDRIATELDSTAFGRSILAAADAASARTLLGAGTSSLTTEGVQDIVGAQLVAGARMNAPVYDDAGAGTITLSAKAATAQTFTDTRAALTVGAGTVPWANPFGRTMTIVGVRADVGTSPTGAALIVDVNKNGTTIFTNQANRPSIAAGGTGAAAAGIDVTSLAAGDRLTVDIDQIGSTVAGGILTVTIVLEG